MVVGRGQRSQDSFSSIIQVAQPRMGCNRVIWFRRHSPAIGLLAYRFNILCIGASKDGDERHASEFDGRVPRKAELSDTLKSRHIRKERIRCSRLTGHFYDAVGRIPIALRTLRIAESTSSRRYWSRVWVQVQGRKPGHHLSRQLTNGACLRVISFIKLG